MCSRWDEYHPAPHDERGFVADDIGADGIRHLRLAPQRLGSDDAHFDDFVYALMR